jgi:DNA-binding CsgD family transcriptional regulator
MQKQPDTERIRVLFDVGEHDEHASRISALLEALGYEAERTGEYTDRLQWRLDRVASRYKLTLREREVLGMVIAGRDQAEIADLIDTSRATVKWHMHNLFAKTGSGGREALLRLVLGVEPPPLGEADAAAQEGA